MAEKAETIKLSKADREALRGLADEFTSGFVKTASFRRRFGGRSIGRFRIIIRQDPENGDFVQICTEVDAGGDLACWCEPPGTCEPGPCSPDLWV
jgi:hypothetical protein